MPLESPVILCLPSPGRRLSMSSEHPPESLAEEIHDPSGTFRHVGEADSADAEEVVQHDTCEDLVAHRGQHMGPGRRLD